MKIFGIRKNMNFQTGMTLWIAACLTACFVAFFQFNSKIAQEAAWLLTGVPAFLQITRKKVDWRVAGKSFLVAVPFLVSLCISFVLNRGDGQDTAYALPLIINLAFAFAVCSLLASWPGDDLWRDVMKGLGLLTAPVFIFVLLTQQGAYFMGRWEPYYAGDVTGAHPNWWGLMALALGWAGLAWQRNITGLVLFAVAAYFMYLLQSRGAMLALGVAFFCCSGYILPLIRRRIFLLCAVLVVGVLGLLLILDGDVLDFICNKILRLHDPQRGIDSGMSGRTQGYSKALDAIADAPWAGKGIGMFGFVHNGFLLICAEGGLLALLGVVLLFSVSLYGYAKHRQWAGAGYILSYIALLMTYPRLFNTNMTSWLALMVMMRGIALTYRFVKAERRIA